MKSRHFWAKMMHLYKERGDKIFDQGSIDLINNHYLCFKEKLPAFCVDDIVSNFLLNIAFDAIKKDKNKSLSFMLPYDHMIINIELEVPNVSKRMKSYIQLFVGTFEEHITVSMLRSINLRDNAKHEVFAPNSYICKFPKDANGRLIADGHIQPISNIVEDMGHEQRNNDRATMSSAPAILIGLLMALNSKDVVLVEDKKEKYMIHLSKIGKNMPCIQNDEYKEVTLSLKAKEHLEYIKERTEAGEKRAGRMHLRRGHFKQIPKGLTWWRPHFACKNAEHKIEKEYKVVL